VHRAGLERHGDIDGHFFFFFERKIPQTGFIAPRVEYLADRSDRRGRESTL
jgi:hypothetical protein